MDFSTLGIKNEWLTIQCYVVYQYSTIWFCKIQRSVSWCGCAMVTNMSQMLTVREILRILPICPWSGTGTQLMNWVLVHYNTDRHYAFIVLIIFQHLLHCLCSAIFLLTWLFLSDEIHVTLQLSHASSCLKIRTQQRIYFLSVIAFRCQRSERLISRSVPHLPGVNDSHTAWYNMTISYDHTEGWWWNITKLMHNDETL